MVKRLAIVAIIAAAALVVSALNVLTDLPSRATLRAGIAGRVPRAAVRTWKPL